MADDIFVEAKYFKDNASSPAAGNSLASLVLKSMATGLQVPASTCTTSMAGKAGADVLNLVAKLKNLGYTASVSGTTLTVSW